MCPYGLIGNCQVSALVGAHGSVDWLSLPRPDSPPVFGRLLDADGGFFAVEAAGRVKSSTQCYINNTTVLTTEIEDEAGHRFRITDFCPRFNQYNRMYRPMSLFRIVEPVEGSPSIRIRCQPVDGWDKNTVKPIRGNSHLKYEIRGDVLRLTTNAPLTYVCDESPFSLKEPVYLALTWSTGLEDDLVEVSRRFLEQTVAYWKTWVKHCSIPSLYQEETIRSALTLKLHCYEDTGAILAAVTTSLPEEWGHERNWDYRFCWLRDSYYVLNALHRLGHFEEMEGFVKFLLNIAENHEHSRKRLRPVYRLDQTLPLPELSHTNWHGYQGSKPVRSGNQAAEHIQNDVYGEMILTLAPVFFDERFRHLRTPEHERLLEYLGGICAANISMPDAGLWEIRDGWQEHSFSNLMCWAGLDRLQKIRDLGYLSGLPCDAALERDRAKAAIYAAVHEGSLRTGPKDFSHDASLLQLGVLSFPDEALNKKTIEDIYRNLKLGSDAPLSAHLYRYRRPDDFGTPNSSFLICSFWLVQAMGRAGDVERATGIMNEVMKAANSLGLFSEHFQPANGQQTGNFPQAYSHVGQINAAFAISPSWDSVY